MVEELGEAVKTVACMEKVELFTLQLCSCGANCIPS